MCLLLIGQTQHFRKACCCFYSHFRYSDEPKPCVEHGCPNPEAPQQWFFCKRGIEYSLEMLMNVLFFKLANTSLMDSRRMKVWKNKHCCNEGVHKRQTMTHMQQRVDSLVTIVTVRRESKTRKLNQWMKGRKWTAAVWVDTFWEGVAQLENQKLSCSSKV